MLESSTPVNDTVSKSRHVGCLAAALLLGCGAAFLWSVRSPPESHLHVAPTTSLGRASAIPATYAERPTRYLRLSNLEAVPEAQVDAGTQRPLVMERVQARPYAASVDGVTTGSPLWWAGLVVILPALLAKSLHARASPSRVIQSAGSYVAMAAVTSARHQGVDDWEKKGDWEEAEQWDDDDDEEDWEETAKRRRPKWSPKSVKVLEKYWREDTSFKCTLNREMGSGWELQVPGLEKVTAFLPYRYAIGELQGDGLDWDDEDDELEEDFDWDGDSEELDAKVLQQAAAEAELATERIDVKILELNVADERLIVSQRAATRTNIFQVVEGPVVSIQPYGVFIDIGRPESGLLHAGQVSQERVGNLEDVFAVGDTVKCMVVSSPHMTSHVILSTKLLEPSPGDMLKDPKLVYEWADETAQRTAHAFRAGTVHEAVVTSLSDSVSYFLPPPPPDSRSASATGELSATFFCNQLCTPIVRHPALHCMGIHLFVLPVPGMVTTEVIGCLNAPALRKPDPPVATNDNPPNGLTT